MTLHIPRAAHMRWTDRESQIPKPLAPSPKPQSPIPNPKKAPSSAAADDELFSATQQGSCSWPELHKLVILHYYERRRGEVNAAYAQFLQKVTLTGWKWVFAELGDTLELTFK